MGKFSYVASPELGREICAVLGINADQVFKMTIELNVDGPAVVIVEAFVPDDNGALVASIGRYHLVANGDESHHEQ